MSYLIDPLLDQMCVGCKSTGGVKRLYGASERVEVKAVNGSIIVIEPGQNTIACIWCGQIQGKQQMQSQQSPAWALP